MDEHLLDFWRRVMDEGTRRLGRAEYKEAESFFRQGASTAEQLEAPEVLAFSVRLLATVRVKLGELESAETGFRQALGICQKVDNAKGMAEAWAGLASVSLGRGSFAQAAQYCELAISVYPPTSPPLRLGMLYSDLGQAYAQLELWEKALKAYDRAQDLCHRYGYPKGEGELKVLMGEICYRRGDKKKAEDWFKEACRIFAGLGDPATLANALQYMAFIYYDQNRMELAEEILRRAVALWLKCDMPAEASESCYFLSKIEQNLGAGSEAEAYIELSIKLYEKEDIGLALRYQSLAGIALTDLELVKAEKYFLQALNRFQALGDNNKAGEIFQTLAVLADLDERRTEALGYHEKAIETLSAADSPAVEARQGLALFYEKHHNYRKALETFWTALQIARENGLDSGELETAIQRVSRLLRKKGRGTG
ncbi:TPR repeat region circular profile [Acididesulfobacillus acetoxydans]|uniref:TPR repeat region circular profile n=1 Tax=Acididesulfobacillus acetoxydans TaxID=1561005 RepID=A0A8S0W7X2_9FIRM|nr:tetratricopeptide repeat protein [Acididesulfobacillus acetoxydans]CAA7601239.1 TPR repeat region circular profile [Acididesulfobacillus acetoxydans]CEJ08482.1 Tetratricopeptide repeat protein [Acididesulfobacillus acetoxydans]